MMTGAILGGSSVQQAARLQMVIMFMISSSTALSAIVTTVLSLSVVVDNEHRVRIDRIDTRPHAVWRARDWLIAKLVQKSREQWHSLVENIRGKGRGRSDSTTERLLG